MPQNIVLIASWKSPTVCDSSGADGDLPRIVHQHVHATEALRRLAYQVLRLVLLGDVALHSQNFCAHGQQSLLGLVQDFLIAPADDQLGSAHWQTPAQWRSPVRAIRR